MRHTVRRHRRASARRMTAAGCTIALLAQIALVLAASPASARMNIPTTSVSDSFSRSVRAGSWGSASTAGGAYTLAGSASTTNKWFSVATPNGSTSGGWGYVTAPTSSPSWAEATLRSVSATDTTQSVKFQLSARPASSAIVVSILGRTATDSSGYRAEVIVQPGTSDNVRFGVSDGAGNRLAPYISGGTLAKDQVWNISVDLDPNGVSPETSPTTNFTTARMSVWQNGQSPVTWGPFSDAAAPPQSTQDAGYAGLRVERTSGETARPTVKFDDFSATGSWTGVSQRLTNDTSAGAWSAAATGSQGATNLRLMSIMVPWKTYESGAGAFSSTVETNIQNSLEDAKAKGYRVILRITAGADAPSWLYTSPYNVPKLDLIATDIPVKEIFIPKPWDATLLARYRSMLAHLNTWLAGSLPSGGIRSDYVHFVPVAMPTELGSEMSMGYGTVGDTFTGQYKGVTQTYNVVDENTNEWLNGAWIGGGSRTKEQNQASLEQAWKDAILAHMQVLTNVPSAIAYGGLFGDNHAAAMRIVDFAYTTNAFQERLWSMTTNLRPNWTTALSTARQTIVKALKAGSPIGFQSAGTGVIANCTDVANTIAEGRKYRMRFLEVSPGVYAIFRTCAAPNNPAGVQDSLRTTWGTPS